MEGEAATIWVTNSSWNYWGKLLWDRNRKCNRRMCVPRFWSTGSTECHRGRLPGSQPFYGTHSRALGLIDGRADEQIMCPPRHVKWECRPQLVLCRSSTAHISEMHLFTDLSLLSVLLFGCGWVWSEVCRVALVTTLNCDVRCTKHTLQYFTATSEKSNHWRSARPIFEVRLLSDWQTHIHS